MSITPADGKTYGIPADNPFVDRQNARPEIYALASAIRGGSPSTKKRAICGSATSAKNSGKKSI